ncbi:SVIL (predicted) [Pycnogonum litorale]
MILQMEVVNKPVPSSVTKSRPIQLFSVTEDLPPKRKFTEVNPIFCPPSEIRKETVDTSGIDSRFPAAPSVPKRSSLDESDVEVLGSKTGDRSPEAIPVRWKSRSISSDANRRNEIKQFDEVDHVAPSTDTKPQLVSKLVQMAEQKMENFKPDRRNEEFSAQDVVHGRKFTKSPVPEVAVVVVVVHDPKIPSEAVGSETTATEIDSRLSSGPAEPVCVEPVVVREPEIKRVAKHEIVVKRTPEKMFVDDGGSTSESNQARVAVSRVRPIPSISNASVCRQRKDVTVPDVETGVQSELTRPKSSIRADRDVDEFKRQIARQKILKLCRGSLWTSQPEFGSRLEPREDDAKEVADSTESSQDATVTDDVAEVESHVRQIDATDDDGSEAQKVSTIWHWPLWADSPKSDDDRNSVKPPPVVVAQRPATRKKMSQIRRGGPLWSSQPEMDSSPEVPESKREPNDICDRSLPVPEQSTQSNALNEPVVELPVSDEETPTAPLNYSVAQKAKMFVSQQSVERHVSTNQRVDTSTSHLHIKPVRTAENVMEAKTGSDEEDKLSGMSLADKIKLFKKKTEEQNLVPTAPARRRRQGDPSRFRTQPVTTEEVENATGEVSSNLMVPSVKVQKSVSMMIANELMAKRKSQPTSGADQTKPNNSNVCRNTEDDRRVKTLEVPSSNKDSTKDDNSGLSSDDEVQSYLRIDVKPSDASKIPTPFKLAENGELKKSKQRNDAGDSQKMNPAVVRRLQANQRRTDHKRIVETNNNKNVSMMTNDSPCIIESTPGLKQRLASLQKSQEDGWKERLRTIKTDDPEKEIKSCSKDLKSETSINDGSSNLKKPEIVKHREQNLTPKSRPVSIADRLNLLESSRKDWRKRVEKSDAEQYTVAGKMGLSPADSPVTPVSQRKFQVPELQIFRSNTDDINRLKSIGATTLFPISPVKPKSSEITKSKSTNDAANKQHDSDDDPSNVFSTPKLFTPSVNVTSSINESFHIDDDSFSSFLIQTSKSSDKLHVQHRKVRAQRKQATSGNPIKKLASRTDLSFAYKEENNNRSNMAESPTKRIKQETSSKKSSMATSALAGLASSEEFAAVSLRKVQDGDSCANTTHNLCPYKDKMLLQIKGRRVIQTRLVEPKYSSINSGDCFILITPDVTFSYVGSLANVIEKSKAADISAVIKTQKDMGYKNSNQEVIILDEDNASAYSKSDVDNFWHLLDHSVVDGCKPAEAGPPSEDETYEASMISTNKVYRVDDVSLVPCEEFWGSSLNYEMLKPEEVFVFDFGTELYVWQGKLSATNQRRISVQLAKELWNQGYDYSSCEFNPIYPMSNSKPKCDEERPNWALLAKINQHMETVLFKEKFFNWPNEDLTNKSKRSDSDSDSSDSSSGRSADLCPCDVNEMLNSPVPGVDMVLEMSHLGRGIEYHDENERRHYEIETRSIKVWHVQEHGTNEVSGSSYGHFYSSDTYVIRWFYTVVQTGRSLSGGASKHSKVGRDRCVYFFWQGRDSSINEKGASALMTVELDKEKGPHMRVIQGKEPPCFLNLFKGNMMVHRGRRLEKGSHSKGDWRLYIVLGEEATETTLIEVQCHVSSLRSRGIFILVNASTSSLYVWYGSKIDKSQRTVARKAIDHLKTKKPSEVGFKRSSTTLIVNRESEGDESDQFLSALHSSDRKLYHSLSSDDRTFDYTMRAFRLTSVSGTFSSIELLCPFRVNNKPCAFPIVQADLYKVTQPALFLIDNRTEAYLWQGWFPKNNTIPRNRWNEEKRCAMQTTIDYCNLKGIDRKNALLVTAGSEPLVFKNLFPEWFDDWIEDLHELDRTDSSRPQRIYDLLNNLKKDNYTFEELKQHPPPQGVNPKRLEAYLAVDEFQKIFDMTKEEFYEKPSWKQLELRKAADLF